MTIRKAPAMAITERSITVCFDGETHAILKGNKGFDELLAAIKEKAWDDIPGIISKAKAIATYTNDIFTVEGGVLRIDGQDVPPQLATKILDFKQQGLPYEGLVAFAKSLLTNPSFRAVQQLFQFLEKNNHAISEEGCFIAYKWVNYDWFDTHTGKTFKNEPGAVIQMPRNQVNEDPNQTCSHGLHVANWDYALNSYGRGSGGIDSNQGRMLEVLVNPKDVVAVPVDYNNAKMRVCEYKVLGEVKSERKALYINKDGTDYVAPGGSSATSTSEPEEDPNEGLPDGVTFDDVMAEYRKLVDDYSSDVADSAIGERYSSEVLDRVFETLDKEESEDEDEDEEEEEEEEDEDDEDDYDNQPGPV